MPAPQKRASGGVAPSLEAWAREARISVRELQRCLRQADQARSRMVLANLRLVVSMARRSMHRSADLEDLIQEGTIGLIRAVERFDPSRGYRFSTDATWWIRDGIGSALTARGRTIRLPSTMVNQLHRLRQSQQSLSQQLGRDPSLAELAMATGLQPLDIREVLFRTVDRSDSLFCRLVAPGPATTATMSPATNTGIAENHLRLSRIPPLHASAMLQAMPERCLQLTLGAGQSVPANISWRVETGYLRASSWTDQTEIFTVGIWGPGEAVIADLLTRQPIELHALSMARVSEWSPEVDERNQFSTTHIRQMSMLLHLTRIRPAEVRLFNLLIWLGERFGHVTPRGIRFPFEEMNLTHRQLGEMPSRSRGTVTKTLGHYRQHGWLTREGSSDVLARSAIALHQRVP